MPELDENPYIGPRPYERADRPLFFGRDREVRELVSLVVAHRVVLLYASSGAGKTSLLNAGLLPLLEEEEGFQVFAPARVAGVQIPAVSNPFVYNVIESWRRDLDAHARAPEASLARFLRSRERPVDPEGFAAARVVVLDQFEEIFTAHQQHWRLREPFFVQLAEALGDDPLLRVVIAIREDHLAQLDGYSRILPGALRTRLRLERLTADAALAAVTRPIENTRRRYAAGVAEQLVADLLRMRVDTGSGGVVEVAGEYAEPVQLQVACRSLWEALPADVVEIRSEHLETFGDIDDVLGAFYSEAIAAASETAAIHEAHLRADVERIFITPGGTRGTVYAAAGATDGTPIAALDELERRHLIRGEFRAGARWLELTHDRLIEPIRASNRAFFGELQRRRRRRLAIIGPLVAGLAGLVAGFSLWLAWPERQETVVPLATLELVFRFEGFRLDAYRDAAGLWTIGAGHALTQAERKSGLLVIGGKTVPWRRGITRKQALDLLARDITPVQEEIDRLVKVKLSSNQLAALTSFVWNVGFGRFKQSVLLRKLNAGDYEAVPRELMRWDRVSGRVLPGLATRRHAEALLWTKT